MRDARDVRTTINLDDDVLEMARMMAAREGRPLGVVISSLLRRAVEPPVQAPEERNGFPLFPVSRNARAVTPELVNELLEEGL